METDEYLCQIDAEVHNLQDQLKTRLEETQNLCDLNKSVMEQSFKLDETTVDLKKTSVKAKWKWLFEYGKWLLILGVMITLFLLYFFKSFIPNMKSGGKDSDGGSESESPTKNK